MKACQVHVKARPSVIAAMQAALIKRLLFISVNSSPMDFIHCTELILQWHLPVHGCDNPNLKVFTALLENKLKTLEPMAKGC